MDDAETRAPTPSTHAILGHRLDPGGARRAVLHRHHCQAWRPCRRPAAVTAGRSMSRSPTRKTPKASAATAWWRCPWPGWSPAMVGLSFAAVPLYRIFCQATGYNGTPQRADKGADHVLDRTITVRFDGNVDPGLPWTLRAGAAHHGREDRRDLACFLQGDQRDQRAGHRQRRLQRRRPSKPDSTSPRSNASASPSRRSRPAPAPRCR